jgi:hypothetical protein
LISISFEEINNSRKPASLELANGSFFHCHLIFEDGASSHRFTKTDHKSLTFVTLREIILCLCLKVYS